MLKTIALGTVLELDPCSEQVRTMPSASASSSRWWGALLVLTLALGAPLGFGSGVALGQPTLAGQAAVVDLRPVFNRDGSKLVSADATGLISVLDLDSGRVLRTFGRDGDVVEALAFSADGRYLAAAKDGEVTLWGVGDQATSNALPVGQGRTASRLAFSPGGDRLAAVVDGRAILTWDLAAKAGNNVLPQTGQTVTEIAFSADGRLLASFGQGPEITLWDLETGESTLTLSSPTSAPITGILFSPVGHILAVADEDAYISLWDLERDRSTVLAGHADLIKRLRFDLEGSTLASEGRDAQLMVWGLELGTDPVALPARLDGLVTGLAFSPDAARLASVGTDGEILLWDLASGDLVRVLEGHRAAVTELAFGPSGQGLASIGADGQVIVWDLLDGTQRLALQLSGSTAESQAIAASGRDDGGVVDGSRSPGFPTGAAVIDDSAQFAAPADRPRVRGVTSLAAPSVGSEFASASSDGSLRLWTDSGEPLMGLDGHPGAVAASLVYGSNNKQLLSGGRDTQIRRWERSSGALTQVLLAHEHPIRAVALSKNGSDLASAGEETRVMLWDAKTGRLSRILNRHRDFVNALAFKPNGNELASGGAEGAILRWDTRRGELIDGLLGHAGAVNALAYRVNGLELASGSSDTTVKLWDTKTGRQLRSLGHPEPIYSIAISTNGKALASAGEDTRIYIWDITGSGALVKTLSDGDGFINTLAYLPNGRLVAGSDDGSIRIWDVESGRVLKVIAPAPNVLGGYHPSERSGPLDPQPKALASSSLERDGAFVRMKSSAGPIARLVGRVLDWLVPSADAAPIADPNQGPGGPILVITSSSSVYGSYYAEILRAEGFNAFSVAGIGDVTASSLAAYDLVILAQMPLSAGQVTMLSDWVTVGGQLIAMRPDAQLAGLLGLTATGQTLPSGYLAVNTAAAPGKGIVAQTMQFHGAAARFNLNGATSVATLYSNATTATSNPAVTLRAVGANGGRAAAFAYDLATSIVYTRQGNPDWANQERDGFAPQRSNDKYYGNTVADPQPDWVDFNKVAIPQADEQQRLLANLMIHMTLDRKPLPRFWYFPRGEKAVVIMTGDDHGNNGTTGRWNDFLAASPTGCSVENWECVRGTSYMYPNTPMTSAQAANFEALGFEVGLHVNTNCADYDQGQLEQIYTRDINDFTAMWPSVPRPTTQRHHCIAWTDWATAAKVQSAFGVRLDTSYYFWPPVWVLNRPGFFNGSGLPMRFADLDGTLIDVYQAATQMTDESGQQYPFTIDTLLNRALGAEGYYGAYVVNAHTDLAVIPESTAVVGSALGRGVPIISSRQMLTWLDGRDSSSFGSISWNGTTLSFDVTAGDGANGLQALVPLSTAAGVVNGIQRNGVSTAYNVVSRKGVDYASFTATSGAYTVSYAGDATAPAVVSRSPDPGATNVSRGTAVAATFSEPMNPATITSASFQLRGATGSAVAATVAYNADTRTATLTPSSALSSDTAYEATLSSTVTDLSGNTLAGDVSWSFTTEPPLNCPCSVWDSSDTPATASSSDPNAVELGVKFRSEIAGYITGIRFYKGALNTGTHVGNLWSGDGTRLATATFTNETATGWQQVDFPAPVAISANTVYVASYHAPNGGYAFNGNFFATSGVDKSPLRLLSNSEGGGNGVYRYGASDFPTQSWNASNYWVDVVFNDSAGPGPVDTTPPTAPTNLTASAAGSTAIALIWTASTDNVGVTGYRVERCTGTTCTDFAEIASVTGTSAEDTGLTASTTYRYRVRATDAAQNLSPFSAIVQETTGTAADTTPPTVTSVTPADGATGIGVGTTVTAVFSEAMDPATITPENITLRTAGNTSVPAAVSYAAATRTATLTPSSALNASVTYTASVKGPDGVADIAGNALQADYTWSFATASGGGGVCDTPCSLWGATATPGVLADSDTSPVELGVKFRSEVDGFITGLSFYKSAQNAGPHVGSLWSLGGQLLAQATFVNETASGWQQVEFAAPVAIQAGTVYVASYHTTVGRYSVDEGYFTTAYTNGPLRALANGESGTNGVYLYGPGGFPTNSYQASNYWVDVVLSTSVGPDVTAPQVSTTLPVDGATNVLTGTDIKATFNEPIDSATIGSATFQLRTAASAPVEATVIYDGATRTAILTPNAALSLNTQYTATVTGGASGVKDVAGNALAADVTWSFSTAAADPCAAPANAVVAENCLAGNPLLEWDVTGAGDPSIQGFATDISVDRSQIVDFKISTPASAYRLDIYRLGYYAGDGARKVDTLLPSASLPQNQPACLTNITGLLDCGNWGVSASWSVPANAVSGIYFAKAIREDTDGASHIVFIVRDDDGRSDILFQTSDTTWQAYNTWGGNSLYTGTGPGTGGGADGRAYKVSYNRPFNTRSVDGGHDWLFSAEYPMVRWLEANGFDVSYFTGIDSDRFGSLIRNHKLFLSVGHDEYWSEQQRANVEVARDAGVHLAFFSGNEVFWKTRWESSIDPSQTDYRTLVCYKETHNYPSNADPEGGTWTGTWRDPRDATKDGGRPENALTGTIFTVNDGATTQIRVPAADGKMRFWRNTGIADLAAGSTATLPRGTLGYEWDEDLDNGSRPAGLIRMSTTTVSGAPVLTDLGSTYGSGTATHHLTLYRATSGALVFGAGTIQWPWGLDRNYDDARGLGGDPVDPRMQQATVNLFADMNVQPATLRSDLVAATASTDAAAPSSTISAPASGANLAIGTAVTISGTATDVGGLVGGVEVSVDGGLTWHPATGRASWSYLWTPMASGAVTIRSRSVDDSGNLETPSAGVAVTVGTVVDTTPPTAPTNLTASAAGSTAIALSWTASTDNVGVTGYRVERCTGTTCTDFAEIASVTGTSAEDTGLTASTTYRYRVRATDAAQNLSPYSAIVQATTGTPASSVLPFSTSGNTNPPAVTGTADNADVYSWNGGSFARALDVTTVGVPGAANLDALCLQGGVYYVSFAADLAIRGVTYQDEDVVAYEPVTDSWSLYFDGTARGLTAGNLDIDAVDVVDGILFFSTLGNTNPPGVSGTADDADIYSWNGSAFTRVLDVSAIGVPAAGTANVDGLSVRGGIYYLSFTTDVTILGVTYQDEDILAYNPATNTWSLHFDGTALGLTANNHDIDALHVP